MDNRLSKSKSWWDVSYKSKVDTGEGVKEWVKETHRVYAAYSEAAACAFRRNMKTLGGKVLFSIEEVR